MNLPIIEVLDAVLEISGVRDRSARHEQVIRLKRRFGLVDLESLTKFEDVYAYAVVEYAVGEESGEKPRELVAFFKRKEVREVFRSAYQQDDKWAWLNKGREIARYQLKGLPEVDAARELSLFAGVFLQVLQGTRSPVDSPLFSLTSAIVLYSATLMMRWF